MRRFLSLPRQQCCGVYKHVPHYSLRTAATAASAEGSTTAAATATVVPSRGRRWLRRAAWGVGGGAALWVSVDYYSDRSLTRSCRAIFNFARVAYLYRVTDPSTPEEVDALHEKGANAILHVCLLNDGLYVKLGQGLNGMSHVLPKQYTQALRVLLDNAATVPFETIKSVVEQQTGRPLLETFERFEEKPAAAASIAQVHRAWLRVPKATSSAAGAGAGGGAETELVPVAVKVLKPAVRRQAKWDLTVHRLISFVLERFFDLPTAWSRQSIVDGLQREMDFRVEAGNAERVRTDLARALRRNNAEITDAEEASRQLLYSRVYIPKIYHEVSSEQVLVMEWMEATKMLDVETVRRRFPVTAVLRTLFDTIGDMIFRNGFAHCDPHAANVLVRPRPRPGAGPNNDNSSHAQSDAGGYTKDFQIVLLDFGLCVHESERFRMQYALFFRSLFSHDWESMRRVVDDWGISDPDAFASMQAQKPIDLVREGNYGEVSREEIRAMQQRSKERVQGFMINQARIPRELPLVFRSMELSRSINRLYGSPVDRLNMFVGSAVRALGPLHDYEGVDAYLTLLEETVAQRRRGDGGSGGAGADGSSSSTDSRRVFRSLYDDDAVAFQQEQARAAAAIAARRQESWAYVASSLYRSVLFQATVWRVSAVHTYTRWVNAALAVVDRVLDVFLGKGERRRLRVEGLEDKVGPPQGS